MKTMRKKRTREAAVQHEEAEIVATSPIADELVDVEVPEQKQPRDWRAWNDRSVRLLLVLAVALAAFAAGRFTVHQGPKTLVEAMQQARDGTLPQGKSAAGGNAAGGGFPGGGSFGGGAPSGTGTGAAAGGAPVGARG